MYMNQYRMVIFSELKKKWIFLYVFQKILSQNLLLWSIDGKDMLSEVTKSHKDPERHDEVTTVSSKF